MRRTLRPVPLCTYASACNLSVVAHRRSPKYCSTMIGQPLTGAVPGAIASYSHRTVTTIAKAHLKWKSLAHRLALIHSCILLADWPSFKSLWFLYQVYLYCVSKAFGSNDAWAFHREPCARMTDGHPHSYVGVWIILSVIAQIFNKV